MTTHNPASFAAFIISRLLKPLPGTTGGQAVSETEQAMDGDDWWWADDNAKVLELLALPEVWSAYPEAVAEVIGFIESMCDGPLIFRRVAAPRLEIEENRGGHGRFLHSLMNISCDLTKGEVSLGMRFHDGRTARNATFGGNYVRFRYREREITVDAEEGIHSYAIEPFDGGVRLVWRSRISFPGGTFNRKVHAGELTYRCTILSRSMFVDFEAELDIAPDVGISDVVLTFGCDKLSHNENHIRYEVLSAVSGSDATVVSKADGTDGLTVPMAGARYWSAYQTSHMAGFAAAIHSLPEDPSRVIALNAAAADDGLIWAVSEHRFDGRASGRLTARERKIITSGGFYADAVLYADVLARQLGLGERQGMAVDLSISYDYGAEINAIARCLRVLASDAAPQIADAPALRKRLEAGFLALNAAYDRYFVQPAHHDLSAVFSRSLAYVAFAHAELAGGEANAARRQSLREICDLIMGFEKINTGLDGAMQSGFVMGTDIDGLPYVDCHAACLLALVRGTDILGGDDWLGAIDRGLSAFCLDTQVVWDRKVDVVCVEFQDPAGVRHRTETFWNFKAGLCLQLFHALKSTQAPALRDIWTKHARRMETFEGILRNQIGQSVRTHEDGVEILTSMLSAETNSETQPWVALGLAG